MRIALTPIVFDTRAGRILPPNAHFHSQIDYSGYVVLPGLINAHDHLELNHFPRTKFRDVYPNAHHWGEDVSQQLHDSPYRELKNWPLWERCWIGGIKNLLSGVTTVVHHNPLHPPLKQRDFPVNVVKRYGWAHSLHFDSDIAKRYRQAKNRPWLIHLAEGTDDIAAAEFATLRKLGAVGSNTILIHGVGLTPTDRQIAIQETAGLVWCPSSNVYLLGHTAQVGDWAAARKLALGSDSRLTADGDLLDELRAAHTTGQVSPENLLHTVTEDAAKMLQLKRVGNLRPGAWADVLVLPLHADPVTSLISARRGDVALVIRKGQIQFGNPDLIRQLPRQNFLPITIDGQAKLMRPGLIKQIRRCRINM